jgi:hypothetical protein
MFKFKEWRFVAALATIQALALAAPGTAHAEQAWTPLLDAKLSKFDVYLSYHGTKIRDVLAGKAPEAKPLGLNPPGQTVFTTLEENGKPVLKITGEYYGCLVTREPYSNYHFRTKVKWGSTKLPPRENEPKDSGILYHSRGPFGVDYWKSWALSHEFQVIEHGMGEYWSQATSAIDIRAAKQPGETVPRWDPKAPWMAFGKSSNNHALAGTDEDKPGEWVALDLLCRGGDCLHIVNGKVVMALKNARYAENGKDIPMTGGTLQIQSEAAEVFYKDMEIRPLAAWPKEYAEYLK